MLNLFYVYYTKRGIVLKTIKSLYDNFVFYKEAHFMEYIELIFIIFGIYIYISTAIVAVVNVVFWTLCGLFTIPDVLGWPKWVLEYKVQPTVNQPVSYSVDIR